MRRFLILLIFFCSAFYVSAQENISVDSILTRQPELLIGQPRMERSLNFDETAFPDEINSMNYSLFDQPLLAPYNKNLDFLKYLNPTKATSYSYTFARSSFNPVFPFGHVFNQNAYRLNDRFVIGGNTFGTQSVFDRPKMNAAIQDMSIRGSSMFMQYKVNDHFKVETRISISNVRSAPWEP